MFALLFALALLIVTGLAVVLGLTPDSRRPGHWYPGLPDRPAGDDDRRYRIS